MESAEIFFEHESWRRNLAWSAGLHVGFTLAILVYALVARGSSGSNWGAGGGGSAMGVTLVSNVPLPANPIQTQSVLATESKGLSKSQPKPAVKEKDAIPIPEKNARKKPTHQVSETQRKPAPEPVEEANNVVPYGEGGPAKSFSAGAATGGIGFTGTAGDFGARYGWYVQIIQQKTQQSWLAYEVDRRITQAVRLRQRQPEQRSQNPRDGADDQRQQCEHQQAAGLLRGFWHRLSGFVHRGCGS